jgi:hypothetical protein
MISILLSLELLDEPVSPSTLSPASVGEFVGELVGELVVVTSTTSCSGSLISVISRSG